MNEKQCPIYGIFYPSNEECYCLLEDDDECFVPDITGSDVISYKSINTDNSTDSLEAGFKKFNLSAHISDGQYFLEIGSQVIENENSALRSSIITDFGNLADFVEQSELWKSTYRNEQNQFDSISDSETNFFGTFDFAPERMTRGEETTNVSNAKLKHSPTKAIGVDYYNRNAIVNNTVSFTPVDYNEAASVAGLSGISRHSYKNKEKGFVCDFCGKGFPSRFKLQLHRRIHTGEKPFACNMCDKKFNQHGNLKQHLLTHTGVKLFSCHICSKEFSHKWRLKNHLWTHSEQKPFSCQICSKGFSLKRHLIGHLWTHSGQKPFSCQICSKEFSRKSNLTTHLRTHNRDEDF